MADDIASILDAQNVLLDHVLLPRVLPQKKVRFIDEQAIVIQFIENVENISEWLPVKTVKMMERLKRATLECTRSVVSEIINELESGDSFSMFIRRQNSTIMFYVPPTEENSVDEIENVIVATFMGNLHPNEIFKHESDIEVNFFHWIIGIYRRMRRLKLNTWFYHFRPSIPRKPIR